MSKWLVIASILVAFTLQNKVESEKIQYFIFSSECYHSYIKQLEIAPLYCYKYTLSKILGYMIIFFGLIMRVPQIMAIFNAKSVEGLSFFSNNMEFLVVSLATGYAIHAQLAFSAFGQSVFLAFWNFIILLMFLYYSKKKQIPTILGMILMTSIISGAFILQVVPKQWQQISIWLQLVVIIFARGSQVIETHKNKTTGVLAMSPYVMAFVGNLVRIFTTLNQSPQDIGFLMNFVIPAAINAYIIFQFWLYKDNKIKTK